MSCTEEVKAEFVSTCPLSFFIKVFTKTSFFALVLLLNRYSSLLLLFGKEHYYLVDSCPETYIDLCCCPSFEGILRP